MSISSSRVLVMADLFIDRLVKVTNSLDDFVMSIKSCHQRGGGNVFGNEQEIVFGGNAGNLARALGVLNVKTTLAVATNELGKALARQYLETLPVDLIVHPVKNASMTVALEFIDLEQHTSRNVMLSDAGDLRELKVDEFLNTVNAIITQHQVIAIVNQASNDHYAELVVKTHERATADTKFFLDLADLSSRTRSFVKNLAREIFHLPKLEWVGMNENECTYLVKYLLEKNIQPHDDEALMSAAKRLSESFQKPTWLLHTAKYSAAFKDGNLITKAATFPLTRVSRTTGAGDTWNAGFLASIIQQSNDLQQALIHANAFAAYFIQENRYSSSLDEALDSFSEGN